MTLGAHLSSSSSTLLEDTRILLRNGCTAVQLFVNLNTVLNNKSTYNKFKLLTRKNKMQVVVHASFTINIAQSWSEYSPHILQFISEIQASHMIGAKYIVIHFGKQLKLDLAEAYNNMLGTLLYVHHQTNEQKQVKILLETSTGQGSEMCYKLEDLVYFYSKLKNKFSNRFGLCLDTCHIFQAGYDITDKTIRNNYIAEFDKKIGINQIKVIHVNDAKYKCGAHKDRHANIGHGYIGKRALLNFITCLLDYKIKPIIILETPNGHILEDIQIINN
jgi:deoxyribonuclease-4